MLSKPALGLMLLFWCALITVGSGALTRFEAVPGANRPAPDQLAIEGGAPPSNPRAQLFLALHPKCPCSRASVRVLSRILSRAAVAPDVSVLMYRPAAEDGTWIDGTLRQTCESLGWRIRQDPDGVEASALGALTSGAVALYDAGGRLLFQGGVTAARGQETGGAGALGLEAALGRGSLSSHSSPVFGCPIQ